MRVQATSLFTYALGFLAMAFWGMSFIWTKQCFVFLSPLATIFFRLVLSSAILFIYLIVSKKLIHIRREDRLRMVATSFFSPFLYFLGENYGLELVTPTTASIIIATIPLITPFSAALFLSERLTWVNVAGIIISFTGVLALIITPDLRLGADPLGIALLFLAVASATGYSLMVRRLSQAYTPIQIIAWQNLIGSALFLPWFLWLDLPGWNPSVLLQPGLLLPLLQLAVFASSLAFIFFIRLIREVGVSKASVTSNLIPVVTALGAFWIMHEAFTWLKLSGMAVVIAGVALAQMQGLKRKNPPVEATAIVRNTP